MPPSDAEAPGGPAAPESETLQLLAAARGGDRDAYDRVFARVYADLRQVASRQAARFRRGASLSTTELVNEAYLKLLAGAPVPGSDRVHFLALAARAMRQILIDHARSRRSDKRGSDAVHVPLDQVELADEAAAGIDLLALDRALERLAVLDAELERLVEWRFFAGMSVEEIAAVTGASTSTVKRDWQVARGFLLRELGGAAAASPQRP